MKRMGNIIPIAVQDLKHLISHAVQGKVLLSGRSVGSVILKGQGIGQHIGCQNISVPVQNVSPGAFDHTFLGGSCLKFTDIVLSLDDLQVKKPADQHNRHQDKCQNQDGCSF